MMGKHVSKKDKTLGRKIRDSVTRIAESDEKKEITVTDYIKLAAAVAILIIISLFKVSGIAELLAYLIPFFLVSYDVILSAIRKINRASFPAAEALVLGCSVLCFVIGSYTEAVSVVIAYKVFLIFDDVIEKKQTKLNDQIRVGKSEKITIGTFEGGISFDASRVRIDDILKVENDCIVPLDSTIVSGKGLFDCSALTGEDTTVILRPANTVPEDSVNRTGAPVNIKVISEYYDSTGRILRERIHTSSSEPSNLEILIDRVLRYFSIFCIPAAVIIAVIPGIITDRWFDWISRAVIIFFLSQTGCFKKIIQYIFRNGLIGLSLRGVYIKNNKVLERLSDSEVFVFEKTGVITEGDYELKKIKPFGISESELLAYAAKAESFSDHPLAISLLRMVDNSVLDEYSVSRFTEYPGKGVSAYVNGKKVYAGKYSFVSRFCEAPAYSGFSGTTVHVCIEGTYSGFISFTDRIKEGVFDALEMLRAGSPVKLVMLTGDSAASSRKMAAALNFDMIKADTTEEDKKNSLEYLNKNKNKGTWVTYVGNNGTGNDILESAEVAVTYVSLHDYPLINGSSDVLIFGKEIGKMADTVLTSDSVIRKVRITALVYAAFKALILILGLAGVFHVLPVVIAELCIRIIILIYAMYYANHAKKTKA